MEVAEMKSTNLHTDAELSHVANAGFSLYVIILVLFGCRRVEEVTQLWFYRACRIPHTSSTSGFSGEWLLLVPFSCWMSRGDTGDIETGQLFITSRFGTTLELLHLHEESRVWDPRLASLANWISFHFVCAELLENVPSVPFLGASLQGVSLGCL